MLATSTFDAAHLYVTEAKKERAVGFPKMTLPTVFEVVADGKIYRVKGDSLQTWIVERPNVAGTEGVHVYEAARAGVIPPQATESSLRTPVARDRRAYYVIDAMIAAQGRAR